MIFYTSDLHFGHDNVIRFDKRPFADVEEMDQYIITRWNERVSEDDTVYILGDICHRNSRDSSWYLKQLKGHKILILGNHDNPILKNKSARICLDKVDKMMQVVDENRQITLCHYVEGRPPKYKRTQLEHALGLLNSYSYAQVSDMTGISVSTLTRARRKMCV